MTPPAALSLAAVSHDLKDPLAAIEVALDFALAQEWAGGATPGSATLSLVRRQLSAAYRAAQRMRRLIVPTLDRGAAEEPVETRAPTPLDGLCGTVTITVADTGPGLPEEEGGTVGARATEGRGAEFWMTLPARAA